MRFVAAPNSDVVVDYHVKLHRIAVARRLRKSCQNESLGSSELFLSPTGNYIRESDIAPRLFPLLMETNTL